MDAVGKVAELLYGSEELMPGIQMSWEQARERVVARDCSLWMPYCIVRDWIWIDLILSEEEQGILRSSGREAVMLYAHSVLFDSERRFDVGAWVRTTPLVSFSEGCFFQTLNTLYVLVGDGQRKQAELSTVMSLF
ncbi:conserved hypothetical protein [Pseudomonas sp. 9AZ]|uniref:DUF6957 family protein n=1 Tax=Pseudomonas sp. 9AZ TaxID=2653168 RepID=UPI0012F3339F|nr:hypothetical protein [Pseudomonas sp. 9AZ]VXD00377.1 conserved hypothetical protein [Pseudomonas sp. 9AZ]